MTGSVETREEVAKTVGLGSPATYTRHTMVVQGAEEVVPELVPYGVRDVTVC